MVLEKTLESPLGNKEIQPIHAKGNQSWILVGSTDPETETPVLWPPDSKSELIRKDPNAGKDWSQQKKGMTEDEMVGWHHWLNGHESEQPPRDEGEGSVVCCHPWGHRELDRTEQLNKNKEVGKDSKEKRGGKKKTKLFLVHCNKINSPIGMRGSGSCHFSAKGFCWKNKH